MSWETLAHLHKNAFSFPENCLNFYIAPGTDQDIEDITVNKTKFPAFMEPTFKWEETNIKPSK